MRKKLFFCCCYVNNTRVCRSIFSLNSQINSSSSASRVHVRCDYKQDRRWKKTEHSEKSALSVCSRTIFKHFFLERKITRTEVSFRDGITLDWLLLSPALPMNSALTHARRIISNFITFCCFHGKKSSPTRLYSMT